MKVSSGSFRENSMTVAVKVSMEAFEEHHLFPLASAHFRKYRVLPQHIRLFLEASTWKFPCKPLPRMCTGASRKLPLPRVGHFQGLVHYTNFHGSLHHFCFWFQHFHISFHNSHESLHPFHGLEPMGAVESFNFRCDWKFLQMIPLEASVAASSGAFPEASKEMRSLPQASMTCPWVPVSSNYVNLPPKPVTYLYSYQWIPHASTYFPKWHCLSSAFDDTKETDWGGGRSSGKLIFGTGRLQCICFNYRLVRIPVYMVVRFDVL